MLKRGKIGSCIKRLRDKLETIIETIISKVEFYAMYHDSFYFYLGVFIGIAEVFIVQYVTARLNLIN